MNAIAPIDSNQSQPDTTTQLLAMIASAVESGGVDKLAILVPMWERIVADARKVAFDDAMATTQAEIRAVLRDAENRETHSRYATYEARDRAIRPIYTKHGFRVTQDSTTVGNVVVVSCKAALRGHSETVTAEVPFDLTGPKGAQNKSATHAWKSAITYGRGVALDMMFNLASANDDDDGNGASARPDGEIISRAQAAELRGLIAECSADPRAGAANERRFLDHMRLGDLRSIEDVRPADFSRLRTALLTKRTRLQQRQRAA